MNRRVERGAWAVGGIGLLASLLGWVFDPAGFAHAWLAAVVLAIGWPLGSIALLYIHALTGGRWGWAIRPQLIFGAATLAIVLPAILPVAFVACVLYPWMHPEGAKDLLNTWYLTRSFFYGRGAAYGVIWLAIGALTLFALRRAGRELLLFRFAAPCLILLQLTVTFAAVDSTLSLEPRFKSSVWGMIVSTEGVLFALCIAVLGTLLTAPPAPKIREDLGKLMLALTIFWAYLDFMQILIVWNSDLPGEAAWYLHRLASGWNWVAGLTALLHFFIPFFVLLWPQMQRSPKALTVMAAMLIIAEIPRAWWLVLPSSPTGFSWIAVPATFAIAGLAIGVRMAMPRLTLVPSNALRAHV